MAETLDFLGHVGGHHLRLTPICRRFRYSRLRLRLPWANDGERGGADASERLLRRSICVIRVIIKHK